MIPAEPSAHPADATPVAEKSLESYGRALATSSDGFPSIGDYHQAYKSGAITPLEVVELLLSHVQRDSVKTKDHSTAFVQIQATASIAAAEASTARWKAGEPLGVLDGVPVAIKDEVDIIGYETTYGSKRISSPTETSWCVLKLMEAGAIVLGKASMHELGTGALAW